MLIIKRKLRNVLMLLKYTQSICTIFISNKTYSFFYQNQKKLIDIFQIRIKKKKILKTLFKCIINILYVLHLTF